jgi:hypothetical protein
MKRRKPIYLLFVFRAERRNLQLQLPSFCSKDKEEINRFPPLPSSHLEYNNNDEDSCLSGGSTSSSSGYRKLQFPSFCSKDKEEINWFPPLPSSHLGRKSKKEEVCSSCGSTSSSLSLSSKEQLNNELQSEIAPEVKEVWRSEFVGTGKCIVMFLSYLLTNNPQGCFYPEVSGTVESKGPTVCALGETWVP